jgi:hypothetical protein
MSNAPGISRATTVADRRVAKALGVHVLAGIPVFLLVAALGLTTAFWVSWLAAAFIVFFRSSRARRAWPWTLAWFLMWLVFLVIILIALLSWEGPCSDCGAMF